MIRVAILTFTMVILPVLASAKTGSSMIMRGVDYQVINPPLQPEPHHKVHVIELFWYGCPHCYAFEPHLVNWLKHHSHNVVFKRVPAVPPNNPIWKLDARAFYAAQVLGILNKTHEAFFDALHKYHEQLYTTTKISRFYSHYGVSATKFANTMFSFDVTMKVNNAFNIAHNAHIQGVPTVIIDGKYKTDPEHAGGPTGMIKVMNYLVKKEQIAIRESHNNVASH